MITVSEIFIIDGLLLVLVGFFMNFKNIYKSICIVSGILLILINFLFDRYLSLDILQVLILATPFVIAKIKYNDLDKEKS
jgi:hypothetical protein